MKKSEIENIINLIDKANNKDERFIKESISEINPIITKIIQEKYGAIFARKSIKDALRGNLVNLKIEAE